MKILDIVIIGDNDIVTLCLEESLAAGHNVKAIISDVEPSDFAPRSLLLNSQAINKLVITAETVFVFCSPSYHQLIANLNVISLSFNEAILSQNQWLGPTCCWFLANKAYFHRPTLTFFDDSLTCEEHIRNSFIGLISSISRNSLPPDYPSSELFGDPYPVNASNLYDAWAIIAKTYPSKIALIHENNELSYGALLEQVNNLTSLIVTQKNKLIALLFKRNINMIAAILAVLKANAAYVPLDPKNPIERNQLILNDANVNLILCDDRTYLNANQLATSDEVSVINVEEQTSKQTTEINLTRSNPVAYVIYTSGSTGKPKGVLCTHLGALNMVEWTMRTYPIQHEDCVIQLASYAFDISVWEIFSALLSGATLVLANDDGYRDPNDIAELVNKYRVTVAHMIPSILNVFLDKITTENCLRHVVSGGEELRPNVAKKFFAILPKAKLYHGYGPTECAITCIHHTVERDQLDNYIPIGKPIQNTQLYIVDKYTRILPPGEEGEAFIGGLGLAGGYLNNVAETNKRFLSSAVYRTGDLLRLDENQVIQYKGRIDQQIKIRGNRVEVEEIERVIQQQNNIQACSVQAFQVVELTIVAFCVVNTLADIENIKIRLQALLPAYMVPLHFIVVKDLPKTVNGKIDKLALQTLFYTHTQQNAEVNTYNPTEQSLLNFLKHELKINIQKIDIDLISAGLNSLAMIYLINFIEQNYNLKLSTVEVFKAGTLEQICRLIEIKSSKNINLIGQHISRVSRHSTLPLSNSQARIWFLHQVEDQASAAYNILKVYEMVGPINLPNLSAALTKLVKRHEILRTTFQSVKGRPHQVINAPYSIDLIAEMVSEKNLAAMIKAFGNYHFDLSKDKPLKVKLLTFPDSEKIVLLILQHNIATDGWSGGIFIKELNFYYQNPSASLPDVKLQYADYALWQNKRLLSDQIQHELLYWKEKLKHSIPLDFPLDKPRSNRQTFNGAIVTISLSADQLASVFQFITDEQVTLYTYLITVLKIILARYTDQTDILIGTGYAGRDKAELKDMLGFFVNTIPLRSQFTRQDTFKDALHSCRKTILDALSNSEIPFDVLVDKLKIEREPHISPLFQLLFLMQDAADNICLTLDGQEAKEKVFDLGISIYDITFNVIKNAQGLHIVAQYNTDLFLSSSIQHFLEHYIDYIKYFARHPNDLFFNTPLVEPYDVSLLRQLNNVAPFVNQHESLLNWFKSQVVNYPNNVALFELPDKQMTYQELNDLSDRLAANLYKQYDSGQIIAIYIDKSLPFFVSMLAVMKSGNTYLILDTELPAQRVQYILADSKTRCVILDNKSLPVESGQYQTVNYNQLLDNQDTVNLPQIVASVCYVLYTSGSTGNPKGVCITQANLLNTLGYFCQRLNRQNVLSLTSISFDIFQLEAYLPLLTGGCCFFHTQPLALIQEQLADNLNKLPITLIQATPSAWKLILPHCPSKSSLVALVGGEALESQTLTRLQEKFQTVYNVYGPTETTIWSSLADLSLNTTKHLGQPIAETCFLIIDSQNQLLPVGCIGELVISGKSVCEGYLHNEHTDKFIQLSFPELFAGCKRFYKTGDKVKLTHEGELFYCGRIDDQVKLRGYRIELDEIRLVLKRYSYVKDAITLILERHEPILVAFIVKTDEFKIQRLEQFLQEFLPNYMIPSTIISIPEVPLNTNGKVDKFKLGILYDNHINQFTDTKLFQKLNPIEMQLSKIWEEILKVSQPDISTSFFYMGGSSLLITELIDLINQKFQTTLTIREFVDHPTISQQANLIQNKQKQKVASND